MARRWRARTSRVPLDSSYAVGYAHGDARTRLKNTTEDIDLSSNEQGSGLLDVSAALGYDSGDN